MQNRYVGDIGDYLKLGILRALSPGYRLGVAWWLFPDEAHNGMGDTLDISTILSSGDTSIQTCSTSSSMSSHPAKGTCGHWRRLTSSQEPSLLARSSHPMSRSLSGSWSATHGSSG